MTKLCAENGSASNCVRTRMFNRYVELFAFLRSGHNIRIYIYMNKAIHMYIMPGHRLCISVWSVQSM